MGMFDYFQCSGPEFVCSEGHDLSGEEFQGKYMDCTLATHSIADSVLSLGDEQTLPRWTTTIFVGASCSRCPVYVQAVTANTCHAADCRFAVTVEGKTGRILAIERCGESTAEFLAAAPTREYLRGAIGPLPSDVAEELAMRIRSARCTACNSDFWCRHGAPHAAFWIARAVRMLAGFADTMPGHRRG